MTYQYGIPKAHFKKDNIRRLKTEGWKKIYHIYINQKKAEVAILT